MEYIFIGIFVWVLLGYIAFQVAEKNGRDIAQAFILGIVGGIFTLIVYWVMGPSKNERLRRAVKMNKDN